ncbi:hypothetical protein Goklo_023428 [Gossypium klotzschianum]|uniref:Uncharacterized protein n=1 Tax=Gossypium klotzschianum TaxID=34286 RepID=A0A7J8TQI5_9ROSI|nr:hypothetical protein [Gossypium klotzschianum]
MFIGIIAIGDKAWVPSLGILPSDLFEDDDNATPEENEKNAIDDVLMSDDMGMAFLGMQSRVKERRKLTQMKNLSEDLNPVMDPYGIPQAVKVFDSLSDEVPKTSQLYFSALKLMVNKEK